MKSCMLTHCREGHQTVQERVYKSNRLWNLLLDMEESIGTMDTTRAAYDRMFDLHIITPQVAPLRALLTRRTC